MLVASNIFMTFAWYGHLRFASMKGLSSRPLIFIVLISWGIAFFEYCLLVPANRIGYIDNSGPFSLIELKVIQEVISLSVFTIFVMLFFQNEQLRWNHLVSFLCLILAVIFAFKK